MSDEIKPRQCHKCGLVFGYNQGHICLELKPKRIISLEAYIKMQNDWLVHWEDYDNGSRIDFEVSVRAAQSTINELLKFNNVEVEND